MPLNSKTALIIGASRGVGRELATRLADAGARTVAVARTQSNLDDLQAARAGIEIIAADASDDGAAARLISDLTPDILILAGGHQPQMAMLNQMSWADFSKTWNTDTKIAFDFSKAALLTPMPAGGQIISFSSGAALNGSPLSGGYAGAKKMQHYISNYANREAKILNRDLSFTTIYPAQLIAGTDIANDASAAYAGANGKTQDQFMAQWEHPLTAPAIADHVLALLSTGTTPAPAYKVTGQGIETFA